MAPECPLAIGRGTNKPPLVCDTSRMEMRLLRETRSVFEYLRRYMPTVSSGIIHVQRTVLQFPEDSSTKTW